MTRGWRIGAALLSGVLLYFATVAATASGSAPVATLAVNAPLGSGAATPYARLGDVFGWLCVICSVASPLVALSRRIR